ncbi:MAG: aminopeptidase P N-terminal domain-containing protein [Paucibacter sp.]|nr:aminopeptidase P N-terminal domain-containing protein [Roseateles sp.]
MAVTAIQVPAAAAPDEPGVAVYAERRARLMAQMPKGAIAFINASKPLSDNLVYRPDSNFWYLVGIGEPNTVAVLRPDAPQGQRYTLFNETRHWETERWTGYRIGQEEAKTRFGVDAAYPIDDLDKQLPELLRDASSLWIYDGGDEKFRDRVTAAWKRQAVGKGVAMPVYELSPTIGQLRLIKGADEAGLLRHAVDLSVQAHLAALPLAQADTGEWALRAAILQVCASGGSAHMPYPPIVGSGANSVVPHYEEDSKLMKQGEMIVNDSACEYDMYAADVTRSYPVGGSYTPEQKAIYDIVYKAQEAGRAKARLGAEFHEINDATIEMVVDGLLQLGILKGDRAELIAKRGYRSFYPHGSSHWLGLDVHDVGSYEFSRADNSLPEKERMARRQALVTLKPGMAFTIEPGIYIPADSKDVDPKWWNIGVRIEDDFLMTEKGVECLSCALPRDTASLEKLIQAGAKRRGK